MKTYTLLIFSMMLVALLFSCQNRSLIQVSSTDDGVLFSENGQNILFYQRLPKSFQNAYTRNNYIHPLWTLDGDTLTEDAPADHLHQRGIFWTWHQTYVDSIRLGDGWECKDFMWDVVKSDIQKTKQGAKTLKVKVLWKSPAFVDEKSQPIAFVEENTLITVYPEKKDYRPIDVDISLTALVENVSIGGSEDFKGYSGFSARIKLPEDVIFTSSTGRVEPVEEAVNAGAWMDINASFEKSGKQSGFSIMCHPDNPGDINKWILRKQKSMQNPVYPGRNPVAISQNQPTILRYRLVIHRNTIQTEHITKLYQDYTKI